MDKSFRYRIHPIAGGLEIRFTQLRRRQLVYSLIWISAWSLILFITCHYIAFVPLLFAAKTLGTLLLTLGIVAMIDSVIVRTVYLGRDKLRLRLSLLRLGYDRSFESSTIERFGIGYYGHSGRPVLKFEIGGKWFVLANDVAPEEVNGLRMAIEAHGFRLPPP